MTDYRSRMADCMEVASDALTESPVAPLWMVAAGLFAVAQAIQDLGKADAATPMGAMEMIAKEIKEGLEQVSIALRNGVDG